MDKWVTLTEKCFNPFGIKHLFFRFRDSVDHGQLYETCNVKVDAHCWPCRDTTTINSLALQWNMYASFVMTENCFFGALIFNLLIRT